MATRSVCSSFKTALRILSSACRKGLGSRTATTGGRVCRGGTTRGKAIRVATTNSLYLRRSKCILSCCSAMGSLSGYVSGSVLSRAGTTSVFFLGRRCYVDSHKAPLRSGCCIFHTGPRHVGLLRRVKASVISVTGGRVCSCNTSTVSSAVSLLSRTGVARIKNKAGLSRTGRPACCVVGKVGVKFITTSRKRRCGFAPRTASSAANVLASCSAARCGRIVTSTSGRYSCLVTCIR